MRAALTLVLALTVPAARSADDPEPPPAANKALEGKWAVTSLRLKGQEMPLPAELKDKMKVVFTKDTMKVDDAQGKQKSITFKLDAKKKPAHIDLFEKTEKKTVLGIYKVNKDELVIAYNANDEGKTRPKDFTGDNILVMVLKKEKK